MKLRQAGHDCRLLLIVGVTACICLQPQAAMGQEAGQNPGAIIRNAIAVRAAISSPSWERSLSSNAVALDTLSTAMHPAVTVLRGRDWLDPDSPPFVIAVTDDGQTIRLGGFPDPDPRGYAASARYQDQALSQEVLASQLAELLDPNGAVELIRWAPQLPLAPVELRAAWEAVRPIGWPAPGTDQLMDGGRLVRVTVLTRAHHLAGQPWQALAYAFQFDREGNLGEWFRLPGPVLR